MQNEALALDSVAILFRTHEQIKVVETIFTQANIPFQLGKRAELNDDVAQAYLLHILKLSCNQNSLDSCIAVLCHKTFGVISRTPKLIQELGTRDEGKTILEKAMELLSSKKKVSEEYLSFLKRIAEFNHEFWKEEIHTATQLIDYLKLRTLLKPTSIHHQNYLNSINEAWEQMLLFMKDKGWGKPAELLHVTIDQVVLEGTFFINNRIKEKGTGVHLLTIHAAKGLEFEHVYIAGANTGIIPLTQHRGSQNLKEEKRLLFVAITRGKNNVEIGWHAQPTFRNALAEPSYFLNSIPESLMERKAFDTAVKANDTSTTEEAWIVNSTIKHKKYGLGILTEITETELICTFESYGEKSFSKAFAKALLEKLN